MKKLNKEEFMYLVRRDLKRKQFREKCRENDIDDYNYKSYMRAIRRGQRCH